MTQKNLYSSIAVAMMFVGVVAMPAAWAQPAQSAAPAASSSQDVGPAPTDAELAHYINATVQVQRIVIQMKKDMKDSKTDAARTKIQQNTEVKVEDAVKSNHLSPARFQQVSLALRSNTALRKRVQAMAQKMQKSK